MKRSGSQLKVFSKSLHFQHEFKRIYLRKQNMVNREFLIQLMDFQRFTVALVAFVWWQDK